MVPRVLLTCIVPVIPLAVLFDEIVSCLRTHTPSELRALAEQSAADGYTSTAGEAGPGPVPMTYLIGEVAGEQRSPYRVNTHERNFAERRGLRRA